MSLIQNSQILYPLSGSFTGSFDGNLSGTASYAATASYTLNALNLIYTGSVTASVDVANNLFLVKSASVDFIAVTSNTTTVKNDVFLIKNLSNQTTLTISQSIMYLPTQSATLTTSTVAGGMYFTSASFYVGLEN